MGRHSAGNQWAFYGSVTRWALPWILVAALAVAGLWWYLGRPEGGDLTAQPSAAATPDADASPTAGPSPTPTATSSPSSSPSPGTEGEGDEGAEPRPLITEGITVQVLDSIGSNDAQERMIDRLTALGFSVPFEAEASKTYRTTTVFWSYSEAEEAARRLAGRFGWKAALKPGNLSADAALHVVVGRDEA